MREHFTRPTVPLSSKGRLQRQTYWKRLHVMMTFDEERANLNALTNLGKSHVSRVNVLVQAAPVQCTGW